jgi:tripartite-type tricarboxylate transporter receptor subunit TctC
VNETVPGYDVSDWYGVGAPKDTPGKIVDRLNKEINAALGDPKAISQITGLGATSFLIAPAELRKFIAEETAKWAKVVRSSGIKPS